MNKIGFLHVPKCAGSALNQSIFDALDQQPFHVSKVLNRDTTEVIKNRRTAIWEGSLPFALACNASYVPGHISYSDFKKLKRNFIFAALRDPRKRIISVYTYAVKRGNSEKVVRNFPSLKKYASMGFVEFMDYRKPENSMAGRLLRDIPEYNRLYENKDWSISDQELNRIIEDGLRRLNVIYACSNQEILDDLYFRGLIPKAKEVWKNPSQGIVEFGHLGTRKEFLEIINRATWQDVLVYQAAYKLFPETVRTPLASDSEILSEVENRFRVKFAT